MALMYPSNSQNSASAPIRPGGALTLFLIGEGRWDRGVPDGSIALRAKWFSPAAVLVTVGGQSADVLYAGTAPFQAAVMQLNIVVPGSLPSGIHPVVVRVGNADNAAQQSFIYVE
jgi:uncharacterized protein (TIGR03437 family)